MYATLFNHVEIANLLITNGASTDKKDNTGSSALDYAISLKNTELINLYKTR